MTLTTLDIYCNTTLVGTLSEEAQRGVFSYLPDVPQDDQVSLLMPVRNGSYEWPGGLMPVFQMNLPEGYKKDLIRHRLGPHADVSDMGLLALTGANTIGRLRAVPHGVKPEAAATHFDMATLLASANSRDNLLRHLDSGITEGVSGVMPKTLATGEEKATVWTDEFILKTGPVDLPGLSINEYLCLEVARHTDLDVPETRLSEDGSVLAVRRFDLLAEGTRLGVEDFCALKGLDPVRKYQGSVEDLARLCNQYVGVDYRKDTKRKLFQLLLLNYALRNADAHLKNYALIYTKGTDARLSPVYDIVTVTAFPQYQDNNPALTLKGKKVWRAGKSLFEFGGARLSLSPTDMNSALEQLNAAVQKVLPLVREYADRYPDFREVGKRMLDDWASGLEDIKADAKGGKATPAPLREQAGMSDPKPSKGPQADNPYRDPNGAFGHKSR